MKKLLMAVMAFTLLAGTISNSMAYGRDYRTTTVAVQEEPCCQGPIASLFSAVGSLVAIPFSLFNTCCDDTRVDNCTVC